MENTKNRKKPFWLKLLEFVLIAAVISGWVYVIHALLEPVQIGNSPFVEPAGIVYIDGFHQYQETKAGILAEAGAADYVYYCTPDGEWHGGKFDSAEVDVFGRVHLTIEGVEQVLDPEDVEFAKLDGRWTP